MMKGRRAHMYFLEPQRFVKECVCRPEGMNFRTKEGKAWKEDHEGMAILDREEMLALERAWDTCPPQIRSLLQDEGPQREMGLRAEWQGLGIQARFDIFHDLDCTNYDLKRTSNFDDFQRQAYNLGMWFQAGWYASVFAAAGGQPLAGTKLIVSEVQAPYRWKIFTVSKTMIDHGTMEADAVIEDLLHRYETQSWLDYEPAGLLDFPSWAPEVAEPELIMESDCVE